MLKLKGFWRPGYLLGQDIWPLLEQESSLHYNCENIKVLPVRVTYFYALFYRAESEMSCLYFSAWNFENWAEENQTLSLPLLREEERASQSFHLQEEKRGKDMGTSIKQRGTFLLVWFRKQEEFRVSEFLDHFLLLPPPHASNLRKTKENKKDLFPDRINPY